jgi:hypothetical protein
MACSSFFKRLQGGAEGMESQVGHGTSILSQPPGGRIAHRGLPRARRHPAALLIFRLDPLPFPL